MLTKRHTMHWNIDPRITTWGAIELRWYGLLFATGLLLCAWKAPKYFTIWGLPKQHAERLTLWVPIGMLLGAHYIHLIFYEQEGLTDLHFDVRSWWPLDVDVGRFWALGSGLASHGGGLGCVLALLLFWYLHGRKLGISFWRYADAVMIVSIFVYPFVRLGNFMNSEIVGRETDLPWGVIFERAGYTTPRHPVVLYEAALYFAELAFAVLWFQPRYARKLRPGATFFFFLALHFSLRFIAEFAKDSQHVDEGWALNMGHLLSLPIILGCGAMVLFTKKFDIRTPLSAEEQRAIDESARRALEEEHRLDVEAAKKRNEPPPPPPPELAGAAADRTRENTALKGKHKKGKKAKKGSATDGNRDGESGKGSAA